MSVYIYIYINICCKEDSKPKTNFGFPPAFHSNIRAYSEPCQTSKMELFVKVVNH